MDLRPSLRTALVALSSAALLSACADSTVGEYGHDIALAPEAMVLIPSDGEYNDGYEPLFNVLISSPADAQALFRDGVATFESSDPFQQVSWMMDADSVEGLQFRALLRDRWTDWDDVEITFHEGRMYNVLIRLDEPATQLELRGGESILEANLEFYDRILAREEFIAFPHELEGDDDRRELPTAAEMATMVAPSSLVVSRSQWNAAYPNQICGNPANVYRMAIHHTAVPSGDDGDPAARMRGMQSYHMNNLNWCDIGYHFVVSQSGLIFQGRSRSSHPAAHVYQQNNGNVGISFIANFNSQTPTNTQKNAGADIVRWVHETHGVPLNRNAIRGHREHPGQSTSCPGTNGIPLIDELIDRAQSGGASPEPPAPEPAPPTPGGCDRIAHDDATGSFFKDYPTGQLGYQEALRLYHAGITNGCQDSPPMFCPSCTITRGQWAAFIARAANLDVSTPPSQPTFSDVPTSHTFYRYIEALAAAGITLGCGGGEFCIDRVLTRAEAATMLARARGWDNPNPSAPTFADVPRDHTHFAGVEALADNCVTNGCGDGTNFCPANEVPRAHAAIFISRAFNLEGSNPCAADPTPGPATPAPADPDPSFDLAEDSAGSNDTGTPSSNITVQNGGCSTTAPTPLSPALALLLLLGLLIRRR